MKAKGMICLFEGCGRPVRAKGYCSSHDAQLRRHGILQPLRDDQPLRTSKKCSKCEQEKPIDAFTRNKKRSVRGGYSAWCRVCKNELSKQWYAENRELMKQIERKYRREHPDKAVEANQRYRARKKGQFIENVNPQKLYHMHNGVCGICHKFIDLTKDKMHMDHIIPLSKGGLHEYGNMQPSHAVCNIRKRDKILDS